MLPEFQKKAREFALKAQEHVASGIVTSAPHEADPSVLLTHNIHDVFQIKENDVKAVCVKGAFTEIADLLSQKTSEYRLNFLNFISGSFSQLTCVPEAGIRWDARFEDERMPMRNAAEILMSTGLSLGEAAKAATCFYTLDEGQGRSEKRYHVDGYDITILLSLEGDGPKGLLGQSLSEKVNNLSSGLSEEKVDNSITRLNTQAGDLLVFKSLRLGDRKNAKRELDDCFFHRSGDGVRLSAGLELLRLRDKGVLPPEIS